MTVPSSTQVAGPFYGNGVTTSYPFTFKCFDKEHLRFVVATDGVEVEKVLDSDYSVTLNGDQDANPGGSITYPISGSPMATGSTASIEGAVPLGQGVDLPDGGAFNASDVERALDILGLQNVQQQDQINRSIRLPLTAATADAELPPPEANNVIGWDAAGAALRNIDPSTLASIVAYSNRRTLVANGGAATYTLAADPGSVHNTMVAVGGVVQTPGVDYTVSGVVLTPTTVWPAGTANVVIVYGEALPVGTVDLADIDFDPEVAYAAPSLGWAQKQSRWSALWFTDVRNAVEAGTDCTAAVQAVYDLMISAGRRSLFFPAHPNGYVFDGGTASGDGYKNGLLLRFTTVNADPATSIVIQGEGSTIFKCGSDNMILLRISRNNVKVRDIVLDYNGKSNVILCGIVPEDMTQTTTLVSQSFVDLVNVGRVGGPGADGVVMQPGPHVGGADSGCFYHNVYGGSANFIGGGRHVYLKKNVDWSTVPNWVTRTNFFGQRLTRGNVGYQFDDGGQICLFGCFEESINSGTTPSATPTARIIGPDCDGIYFFGGYPENCTKSITMSAKNVYGWGFVPASGSNIDWRTYARAWADETDDDLAWTPVLNATSGTQGAGTALGRLTKQGKTVKTTIQLSLAKGTLSGNLSISGLPFVADTAWGSQNLEVTSWSGITLGTNYVKLNAVVSGAAITLQRQHGQGAGVAPLTVADCADPIVLTIEGSYTAT